MKVLAGASIKRWLLTNFRKVVMCTNCNGEGIRCGGIGRMMARGYKCEECRGTGIRWRKEGCCNKKIKLPV